jgi:dTDP-4-amino-4,6-dideoxygalactose transaminase
MSLLFLGPLLWRARRDKLEDRALGLQADIQAAVGREQLKRLPEIFAARRAMADRYKSLLSGVPGLGLPEEPAYARSNWQSFCVRLPAHADQRAVMQRMLDEGVSTRRGIMCSHREQPYQNGGKPVSLPHSEAAQDHCLVLPLFPQLPASDQERVAALLAQACLPR